MRMSMGENQLVLQKVIELFLELQYLHLYSTIAAIPTMALLTFIEEVLIILPTIEILFPCMPMSCKAISTIQEVKS